MPTSKPPLQSLTIFLSEPGVTDPEVILKEPYSYESFPMKVGDAFFGVLYVKPSHVSPPDWLEFIAPAVDDEPGELPLSTSSASAVWLIQRSDHVFALSFGFWIEMGEAANDAPRDSCLREPRSSVKG